MSQLLAVEESDDSDDSGVDMVDEDDDAVQELSIEKGSGRNKCRTCAKNVAKAQLMFRQATVVNAWRRTHRISLRLRQGGRPVFHHAECLAPTLTCGFDGVAGVADLSRDDKAVLRALLE